MIKHSVCVAGVALIGLRLRGCVQEAGVLVCCVGSLGLFGGGEGVSV